MADHDQRMKEAVPAFLPEFVALGAPDWSGWFAFASAQWLQQETFLDPPRGERRLLDLVARLRVTAPIGDFDEAILHVEIESGDSLTDLRRRMPGYRGTLRSRYGVPVLSFGLYLSVGLQGAGWDQSTEEVWGEQTDLTRWRYVGLPHLDAIRHVEGDNLLAVALSVLMRVPEDRQAWLKATAMERVGRAPLDPIKRGILVEMVEAYMPLHEPHQSDYDHLLLTEEFQMARQLGQTSREKGEDRGRRETLSRLLVQKFGALGPVARARLETFPPERLGEIEGRIFSAATLTDLGLEDAPKVDP